jgi:hypothetical protein
MLEQPAKYPLDQAAGEGAAAYSTLSEAIGLRDLSDI